MSFWKRWQRDRKFKKLQQAGGGSPGARSSAGKSSKVSKSSTARRPAASKGVRWARWIGLLVLALAALGTAVVVGLFVYYGLDPELPRIEHATDFRPPVVSRVLDRNGELLGEIFEERRTVVPREKIPAVMVHAIVDAEDAQFYEHKGLNYTGMLRALLNNLRPGAHLQGGSTITQQLVKTYLLKTNERTLKRKVQEVILARRLDAALTKDEVLYIYLNLIYFGHQRYGVEEAARFYFGKSVSDINAGEAALLASLPKGPEEISPIKHPERAKDRQRYVLSQMVRYGHLSKAEADAYADAPIQVVRPPQTVGAAPEFVDAARRVLQQKFGDRKLGEIGTSVETTCDVELETAAREALERRLMELDERQGYRKPVAHLKQAPTPAAVKQLLDDRALHKLHALIERPTHEQRTHWLAERAGALAAGKVTEAVVVEVRKGDAKGKGAGVVVDGGAGPVATKALLLLPAEKDRYNPKALPVEKRFAVGDVLTVRAEPSLGKSEDNLPLLVPEFGPQAALVAIDPTTREVRALIGGYGFHPGGFDRATMARRQPGSSFKPFLYATAFGRPGGKYTPATVMNDSPQVYDLPGMPPWKPKNAESHEFLGPVRLRTALAKSLNTVASQLVFDIGAEPLAQTARACGIESKLEEKLSLGIGASVVNLLELTNAYATFATYGKHQTPLIVAKVGDEVTPRSPPDQALSPEVAYLTTSLMESVIDEGTAQWAKSRIKRPAAGKTGTTNSERDAWFVGFTPDLVVGVWVGFDDMRDLGHGEQGAKSALPIWVDAMNAALKPVPPKPFLPPPGIVVARIDPVTGLLAPASLTTAIDEKFLAGTAPTQVAPEPGAQNPDTFLMH